jgi:hypothetical protein
MKQSRKTPDTGARRRAKPPATDRQPPATGAHRGSPAAPVMKQFAKTRTESGGRS